MIQSYSAKYLNTTSLPRIPVSPGFRHGYRMEPFLRSHISRMKARPVASRTPETSCPSNPGWMSTLPFPSSTYMYPVSPNVIESTSSRNSETSASAANSSRYDVTEMIQSQGAKYVM